MNQIENIRAYVPDVHLFEILPFLILLVGGIGCLIVDAATNKDGSRRFLPVIAGVTLLTAIISYFFPLLPTQPFIEGTFYADEFGRLACIVILFSALAMTIMGPRQVIRRNLPSGEFYALILFSSLGMVLLATSNELLTAFVSLEIMSLALYVLTGIDRRSGKSAEASFKYFILGAFASAFLVLGIAFLFGATRTTFLTEMVEIFKNNGVTTLAGAYREGGLVAAAPVVEQLNPVWTLTGFGLIFVGVCFKLSLAPFHMWAPDVYEGSNTPTTVLIATGSKVAAFAFFIHIVSSFSHWEYFTSPATFIIGLVAVISMVWGNIAAVVQSNLKRMLAYSSVAQTGYMMVALMVLVAIPHVPDLAGAGPEALAEASRPIRQAISLYLAGYTIMTVLAFGLAFHLKGEGPISAYRGLFQRKPLAAFGMAIAMFSFVGIGFTPPTIGFMGKYFLFKEAVKFDLIAVAVIAVLTSVVSAFYYLNVVVVMFMKKAEDGDSAALAGLREEKVGFMAGDAILRVLLTASAVLIFLLGFFPNLFIGITDNADAPDAPASAVSMVRK